MKLKLLAMTAAIAFATPVQAADVITNGSFETGDFSGWTQFGNTGFTSVVNGSFYESPTDGNFQAVFGPVSGIGGISQIVAEAGEYTVSFDLGNSDGIYSSVDFGGINLLSGIGNSGFTSYSFTVNVAANSVLSFAFQNPPAYYTLDNVVVTATAAAVPEPGAWALMLIGFGAVGAAMRRRRRVAPVLAVAH